MKMCVIPLFSIMLFASWKNARPKPVATNLVANKNDSEIVILNTWQMPHVLKEISGIAWLNAQRFACVQDEKGKIFIFNTAENKIEKEIAISELNDFEGIAIVRSTAWLLRSDGTLFEAKHYMQKPVVKEYNTFLNKEQNTEGLCYDAKNNRLLLAIKGRDPLNKDQKGIYSFNLRTKKVSKEPLYKIDLNDLKLGDEKNERKMRPSDLAVHPLTGDIYILDGEIPKLLILNSAGTIQRLYTLNRDQFALPEGITFTTASRLFISNEGKGGKGNILEVKIGHIH